MGVLQQLKMRMEDKKNNRWLLFLCFISFSSIIILILSGDKQPNDINRFLRYIVLPPIIFFLSTLLSTIFIQKIKLLAKTISIKAILSIFLIFIISFFSLIKHQKYQSYNYEFYDLGLYLAKISQLANHDVFNGVFFLISSGHFQPYLFLFSFISKITGSYFFVLLCQTFLIFSAVVPLFMLAKKKIKSEVVALIISLSYLVFPALLFSDVLGFHPDHLVLISLLWAFYFSYERRYLCAFYSILPILLAGELLYPTAMAFGLYLWLEHKKLSLFLAINLIFSFAFLSILFIKNQQIDTHVYSQIIQVNDEGNNIFSSYLWMFNSSLNEVLSTLITGPRYIFILFLVMPFIYLYYKNWFILLVAVPDLTKTLLSNETFHHSIEGHYSYAIIAVFFVGFVINISRQKLIYAEKIAAMSFITVFCLGIVHSPLPYSLDFFTNFSSGTFNYKQYQKNLGYDEIIMINKATNDYGCKSISVSNTSFSSLFLVDKTVEVFPGARWMQCAVVVKKSDFVNPSPGKDKLEKKDLVNFYIQKDKLFQNYKLHLETDRYKLFLKK